MFSKIIPDDDLAIITVNQVTKIIVDESGSEAAAVTATDDEEGVYDPYFIVDSPFVVVIAETSTGLPLFIGRIEKL